MRGTATYDRDGNLRDTGRDDCGRGRGPKTMPRYGSPTRIESHVTKSGDTTVAGTYTVLMSPKELLLLTLILGVGLVAVLSYTDAYPPAGWTDRPPDRGDSELTTESLFEETDTDGVVPTPPERASEPPEGFPPGLTRERIENPATLTRAHQQTLLEAGSWTQHTTTTVFVNATAVLSATETALVAESGDLARGSFVVRGENPPGFDLYGPDTAYWVNETAVYVRFLESNRTAAIERDDRYPVPYDVESTEWRTLYRLLGQTNTSFEGTVGRGEATLYRVVATTARYDDSPYGNVRDLTMSALITSDGVIKEYVVTYLRPAWGEGTRVVIRVEYSEVGTTTVERPDWVPTGPINLTEIPNTASGATVESVSSGPSAHAAVVAPSETTLPPDSRAGAVVDPAR